MSHVKKGSHLEKSAPFGKLCYTWIKRSHSEKSLRLEKNISYTWKHGLRLEKERQIVKNGLHLEK